MFFIHLNMWLILITIGLSIVEFCRSRRATKDQPPSPLKLPIIGHLHLLVGYEIPYQAFTTMAKKFGQVYKLQLGYVKCVVVNGQKNIREVLVTKGSHFDSRPNFERYQQLFCGNKENSLAFCNWSSTQRKRRDMLKAYTFPRAFTNRFYTLEELIANTTRSIFLPLTEGDLSTKSVILRACANIFTSHFCSKNFDFTDKAFIEMVENYDEIFYEVNQGYAADFLPFLMPLHKRNLKRMNRLTRQIRGFVLTHIVGTRLDEIDIDVEPNDYVDSLISHVKSMESSKLTWDSALFALEDIIGGHSAVANFLIKLLAYLAREPDVQANIQKEIDDVLGHKELTISDRRLLPYVEATILEAIRLIASPIVPRVANCDSSIEEYHIEKGTVIFLNNYELSMSEDLWEEPHKFLPARFIRDGRLVKPDHFLPFGAGRRSCMGYKMVQLVSFGLLGGLMQHFIVLAVDPGNVVPAGSLALPKDTFTFKFVKR